mmetsp:Transcript_6624/g.20692  ORF Transcript_6624/g.20692 Transcript_6624/m.20692 type:complete len:154 (-) Transcript_6624:366-827(-)
MLSVRTLLAAAAKPCAAQRVVASSQARRCLSTYFTKSHEYLKVEGSEGTVGITTHAAEELGDIVFVDLPTVGDPVTAGEVFGAVESVKAASDVYSPVTGVVTEINDKLEDTPNLVNDSAEQDGWFMKVKLADDAMDTANDLIDADAYAALIEK